MNAKKIIAGCMIMLTALLICSFIAFSDEIIITHEGTGRSESYVDGDTVIISGCDGSTSTKCSVKIRQPV